MEAKPEQLSELTQEVQQPFQLTADVDSFGDEWGQNWRMEKWRRRTLLN